MLGFLRFASLAVVYLMSVVIGDAQGVDVDATSGRSTIGDSEKTLVVGDWVTIKVSEGVTVKPSEVRGPALLRVVTDQGDLDVPSVGKVKVGGLTTTNAASEIEKLFWKDYYLHATVRISFRLVNPAQAGVIDVAGEVRVVGRQEITAGEKLTLSQAISKAGGFGEWADLGKVRLMWQRNGETETTVVNLKAIIKKGDADPVLQDGDRIFVPKIFFGRF
jgi:protein involved in polysaccharide export with SLBB domain